MPYLMRRATETKTALSSVMIQKRLMNVELWRRIKFWNKEEDGELEQGEDKCCCCKSLSKYCEKFKCSNLSDVLPDTKLMAEGISDLLETAKSYIPFQSCNKPKK